MRLVFDLDGVLVETREANLRAYRSLGIEAPADFHTRPWQEWCSEEDHDRKQSVLKQHIGENAILLPMYYVLEGSGGVILTNASTESVRAVLAVFPCLSEHRIVHGRTPDQKIEWLEKQSHDGVYFDDSEKMVRRVNRETRWRAVWIRG